MEHVLLKAATTAATDEGVFEAVISAASIDREKDIVDPTGMVRALQKWVATGKKIPLAWQHSTAAEDQIGYIDPATVKAVDGEVVARGWIDQSTEVGAHAWRLVKMGTLGFSFGYLTLASSPRKGGGRHLKELDVFEVTATPGPMNNDTRVLGWKADVPSGQLLNAMLGMAQKFIANEDDADDIAAMRAIASSLRKLGAAEASEPDDAAEDTSKALRRLADAVALDHAAGKEPPVVVEEVHEPEVKAEPEPVAPDAQAQRRKAEREEREANDLRAGQAPEVHPEHAMLHITHEEMDGLAAGDLKAVWSAAFVNNLPDSSFLYVESGGDKDADGKTTPRSLRHFPYKDASGNVDLPHLRNALARIPQSNLPPSVKDQLTAKAQRILDAQKSVDVTDKETKSRSVDPLRAKADTVALEYLSDGESRRKPPHVKVSPRPVPTLTVEELKQRTRDETLKALSGVNEL